MYSIYQVTLLVLLCLGLCSKSFTSGVSSQYLGCFDTEYALAMKYEHHIPDVNLEKCLTFCGNCNIKYAGIEKVMNRCYCGSDILEFCSEANVKYCDVKCPENSTVTCGGHGSMSVYLVWGENKNNFSRATPTTTLASKGLGFLVSDYLGGFRLYNSSNLSHSENIMNLKYVFALDYHLSKNLVFALAEGNIYKSTLKPELSVPIEASTVVTNGRNFYGFAVDWVHDRIYWSNHSSNMTLIMSCDLSGKNMSTVLKLPELRDRLRNMIIDPYARVMFWRIKSGVIESSSLSGTNFQTNMTEFLSDSICLDITARRVYYTAFSDFLLHSMDYTGSRTWKHVRMSLSMGFNGLGVFRGYVYWIDNVGLLYQAPLKLTNLDPPQVLKNVTNSAKVFWGFSLNLVHPELQTHPGTIPCDIKGCSHHCIMTSLRAECLCPMGYRLDNNGTTCIIATKTCEEA